MIRIVGQGKDFSVNRNGYTTVPAGQGHGTGARVAAHGEEKNNEYKAIQMHRDRMAKQTDIRKKLVKEFAKNRKTSENEARELNQVGFDWVARRNPYKPTQKKIGK